MSPSPRASMRRLTLLHGILAFLFNVVVLALRDQYLRQRDLTGVARHRQAVTSLGSASENRRS